MNAEQLNTLAAEIYADNVAAGWWDDPDRDPLVCLQLISTEIAEATEGERKNLMDYHLPHRRMGEVELADALIRTLDFGGRYGLVAGPTGSPSPEQRRLEQATGVPAQHFVLTTMLADLGWGFLYFEDINNYDKHLSNLYYSLLIDGILATSKRAGYDIEGAMAEKRAYNKTRADHTPEARGAEHGKKF
jgi:hypothetical protein